jgi:hypothetical protein
MTNDKSNSNYDAQYVQATREAELGVCTCRNCGYKGQFSRFITILYGGGLVYAMCLSCADSGDQILIRRGNQGVEVLKKSAGQVAVVRNPDLDVLKKRIT